MSTPTDGFSLIEIVIVMGLMSILGVGTMTLLNQQTKGQKAMTTAVSIRDLVEEVRTTLGFEEVCTHNFENRVITPAMTPLNVKEISLVDGTVRYAKDGIYESQSVRITKMSLSNYQPIVGNTVNIELRLDLEKLGTTGTVSQIVRFVPLVATVDDVASGKIVSCNAAGGSGANSQLVCEDMSGTYNAATKRCVFEQVLVNDENPKTLTESFSPFHLRSRVPASGNMGMGVSYGDFWADGGSDSVHYFSNTGNDTTEGGWVFGSSYDAGTSPLPPATPAPGQFRAALSILNDGRVGVGYEAKGSTAGNFPFPAGGGVYTDPTAALYVRGNASISKHLTFSTDLDTVSAGKLMGYLGGGGLFNDVELGSTNPNVNSVSLWNASTNRSMSLLFRHSSGTGICLGSEATLNGDCGSSAMLVSGAPNNGANERLKAHGDIVVTGLVYSGGTPLTSDVRFKENIRDLEGSVEKILQLRGVEYDWKKDPKGPGASDPSRQIGLIAQEVEKIFPEAVLTSATGNRYKSVKYNYFIPVLIEALKEAWQKITDLETKNSALETRLTAQEKETSKLKELVCLDHPEAELCRQP